jgi:L-seryl-tRNA(Ser) seleniumtransferase
MIDPRRALPSVNALLESESVRPLLERSPRGVVLAAVRATIEAARVDPSAAPHTEDAWAAAVGAQVVARERPTLVPVLNATGVVLHTNLGRAPLATVALNAMRQIAEGFSNLEFDLEEGTRGSRSTHCAALLAELTGAEDAFVVNNCAAALVLGLTALAAGREAIVSRGELIEIGGSFRVPEIMTASGARLREVGTTNRTHLEDYRAAIDSDTGAIVKVHRSNFTMSGFVADASLAELAALSTETGVPLLHDFGSGLMISLEPYGLAGEPTAADQVRSGATLVFMSGDKLFGGPQAGLILGTRDAIATLRQHPLARALRVDKLTIAALQATLLLYRDPVRAAREIPTLAMITQPVDRVARRAEALASGLRARGITADAQATEASVGGGAFPSARIASCAVRLSTHVVEMERRLRTAAVPVIGRIADGGLLLDLRSVPERDDVALLSAVVGAVGGIV